MSINQFTEDSYEQTLIVLFKRMGYQYECGYDVERDFREPWYGADLQQSLRKLNAKMSSIMMPIHQQIISLEIESRRLTELRDTLLPRLMSGKLIVKEIG